MQHFKHSLALLLPGERKRFFLLAGVQLLIMVLDIVFVALLFWVVNEFIQPQRGFFSALTASGWSGIAIGVLLFFLLKNMAGYHSQRAQFNFVYVVAARLSSEQLAHYQQQEFAAFTGTDASVHTRTISQVPVEFCHYVLFSLQQLIQQGVLLLVAVAALVFYYPLPFLFLFMLLAPVSVLLFLWLRKAALVNRQEAKKKSAAALQYLREALDGYTESNLYAVNDYFNRRYSQSQQALNQRLAGIQAIQALPARFMEWFGVLGLIVLLGFYKAGYIAGMNAVSLGVFVAAAYKIIPGLSKCLSHYSQLQAYAHTVTELAAVFSSGKKQEMTVKPDLLQSIRLENVSFSYNNKPVLDNISFTLKSGQLTGIRAVSGKGKTTLLNMLLGLLEADNGTVYFNEKVCNAEERRQYWPQVALVKQEGFFLHDSLAANIAFADGAVDKKRMEEVIRICGLTGFADGGEDITQYLVTQDGRNISGGQRQRIAMARALYKQAPVLLADEPFNEMDEAAATFFTEQLKRIAGEGKLVLLITHSPKQLAQCDKTISLDRP